MKTCGIYKISSICKPERVYVGSARNIAQRWRDHKHQLLYNKHHSKKLQRHFNKYGWDDLVFEVIEENEYLCKQHLLSREQGWYFPYEYKNWEKPFFNNLKIAGSGEGGHHTQESRAKMSKNRLGKKKPPSHGPNVSKALKGKSKNLPKEVVVARIEMLAKLNRGRKKTPESLKKQSESLKRHWAECPRKPIPVEERKKHGRPCTDQKRAQISEAFRIKKERGWKRTSESQYRERDEKGVFIKKAK